jgi:hypothetical protein
VSICNKCLVPDSFPGVSFSDGICSFCRDQKTYLRSITTDKHDHLKKILTSRSIPEGKGYHCLVPVSGGKDSTYALYYITRHLQLKPLAAYFDSGFTVDLARRNVKTICARLGVDCVVVKPTHNFRWKAVIEAIHMSKSMGRLWGICTNCENELRTMVIKEATARGIPYIIWGSTDLEDSVENYNNNGTRKTFRQSFGNKRVAVLAHAFSRLFGRDFRLLYRGPQHVLKFYYYVTRDNFDMGMPGGLKRLLPQFQVSFKNSQVQLLYFYDYVNYDPFNQMAVLKNELGWEAPSGKEARMDCWLHCLVNFEHLRRTGISGDGFILANLVRNGLLTRSEALTRETLIREGLREECHETLEKLGINNYHLEPVPDLEKDDIYRALAN